VAAGAAGQVQHPGAAADDVAVPLEPGAGTHIGVG
jgi:hypothetical protein